MSVAMTFPFFETKSGNGELSFLFYFSLQILHELRFSIVAVTCFYDGLRCERAVTGPVGVGQRP